VEVQSEQLETYSHSLTLRILRNLTLSTFPLPKIEIIGSPLITFPLDDLINMMLEWAQDGSSKSVCIANTQMLIEAHRNPAFRSVLREADLITPDDWPLVCMLKLLGVRHQNRVGGMETFLTLCQKLSQQNLSVFFVGSQTEILNRIQVNLARQFPHLHIAGMEPLPMRQATAQKDDFLIRRINASGASIVFVSLGYPQQENWMAKHKGFIQGVTIGLGSVFPVYAGIRRREPQWVRICRVGWLYHLFQRSISLWKQYRKTMPIFTCLAVRQLMQ
jgi:N-acetylglucosaminyldiphosphoundecaprenol N-acetyl-beta-D-mannosaminyltransferase